MPSRSECASVSAFLMVAALLGLSAICGALTMTSAAQPASSKNANAVQSLSGRAIAQASQPIPPEHGKPSEPTESSSKDMAGTDVTDEVLALKERIIETQNKSKLGLRKSVICSSVEDFGIYSPIEPGQPLRRLLFYCEPSNVSTLKSGDRYIVDCSIDFLLLDSSGRVMVSKENAIKINKVSRSPVIDLFFKFALDVRKPLDRSVSIRIVLHDKIKNQSVTATHRINVEPATKKRNDGV